MSQRLRIQVKTAATQAPSFPPVRTGILQRKCACGGSAGMTGECEECGSKQLTMRRRTTNQAEPSTVPPIVHEVLRSPGQPLDSATRALVEPRFGHDFSKVRVHTDTRAAESAREVNALAYTVGRDLVFGAGQYAPETTTGRRLLTHELTHVVQQGGKTFETNTALRLGSPKDVYEQRAETLAASNEELSAGVGVGSDTRDGLFVQRAEAMDSTQTDDTATQSSSVEPGGKSPDRESDCSGWQSDPQSISKVAAEHYVRTELGLLLGSVDTIQCDPPPMPYACGVTFTGGLVITVLVWADHISVTVSPTGRRVANAPFCIYDYRCPPSGELVLTKRRCAGAKAP